MKKLFLIIFTFICFCFVINVNAQYLSMSDFKDIEKHNFSNAPALQETSTISTGGLIQLSSGFYGNELDNSPSNNHNYIIFGWDFSAYNENYGSTFEFKVDNLENSKTLWISYNDGLQYNCDYLNGYIYCPYEKGKTINTLMIRITGAARGNNANGMAFLFKSRIKITYYYGNLINDQSIIDSIDNQTQFIQNSDTTGANTGYGSVFNESVADTTGTTALFGVLQNFISNLSSNDTCASFSIPIPFINNKNVVLPCMRSIYIQHFGLIYNLVQIILSAIIFYWCVVNVLKLFKETLDPFNYKLEVLDL